MSCAGITVLRWRVATTSQAAAPDMSDRVSIRSSRARIRMRGVLNAAGLPIDANPRTHAEGVDTSCASLPGERFAAARGTPAMDAVRFDAASVMPPPFDAMRLRVADGDPTPDSPFDCSRHARH